MSDLDKKIACWWSGGVTSAVACKLAIDCYGKDKIIVLFIDTNNEHEDTYRFKNDCSKWYDCPIDTISSIGDEYKSIQDVWRKHKSLNVAHGAICSTQLKRRVREQWQKVNNYEGQVFGFEFEKKEFNRAMGLKLNHPKAKPIFPLLMMGYDKDKCLEIIEKSNIQIPMAYKMGFLNNNCLKTGCVQGGISYWKKMQKEFPEKFESMSKIEHELTEAKGKPVTMLKDQSNKAKETGNILVFLKKNKYYPELKSIDDMPDSELKPLFDCNGFCGTNDFTEKNNTENEINFDNDNQISFL